MTGEVRKEKHHEDVQTDAVGQVRKPMTVAENAALTIKILLIAAAIIGSLMAFIQFTR
jgi:hypothetical protein